MSGSEAILIIQQAGSVAGGATNPAYGQYTYMYPFPTVTIRATPSANYAFDHFEVNGVVHAENPMVLSLSENSLSLAVTAYTVVVDVYWNVTSTQPTPPAPPISDSGQGNLHVNPLSADGSNVTPEAEISYPEGSPEFAYILEVIGNWSYYTSPQAAVPNTACRTTVSATDADGASAGSAVKVSSAIAYIYGYMPGSENWTPNSCTAFILPDVPTVQIIGASGTYNVTTALTMQGNLNFQGSQTGSVSTVSTTPPPTTFTLTLVQSTGGTVSAPQLTGFTSTAPYDTIDITAAPTVTSLAITGYTFDHWIVDGTAISDTRNPLPLLMNSDHTVQAVFSQGTGPTAYSDVTITVTGQGTTTPAAGNYPNTYLQIATLDISATPASGWTYQKMQRNGADWTGANPGEFLNLGITENINVIFTEQTTTPPQPADNTMLIAGVAVAGAVVVGGAYAYSKRKKKK
jgi:hypothetical protein